MKKKTKIVSKVITKTKIAVMTLGVAAAAASVGLGGYMAYQEFFGDDFIAQYSFEKEYKNSSSRLGFGALRPYNATFVDGCKAGSCVSFHGDNSYLALKPASVPLGPDFNAKQQITISAWVYRNSITSRTHVRILSQDFAFFLGFVGGGKKVSVDTGNGKQWDGVFSASKDLPLKQWVLVTYTLGQNFSKLYYNDKIVATDSRVRSLGPTSNEFTVSGPTFAYNDSFDGMIDEVRVFTREVSFDQIREMYQSDSQASPGSPTISDPNILSGISLVNASKQFFSERQAMPTPADQIPFVIEQGSGKVLITAPHSTNQIRNGSVKLVDYCTGPIAKAVAKITGVTVMYQQYQDTDPNYYDDTPFKKALGEYLETHPEVTTVFDIHGAAEAQGFDIDLGDMKGASLVNNKNLATEVEALLKARGILQISHNFFTAMSATDTRFASSKGRDALQFEINRTYRCSTSDATSRLVDAFVDIVNKYK